MVAKPSLWLLAWDLLTRCAYPLASIHLRRRIARGKEHPTRWREKLGHTGQTRPEGILIWLHAVGLGEVLALRGMIDALSQRMPNAQFLVTSSTRASAEVFENNLPMRTIHQFAPLDIAWPIEKFLDQWHPDLLILAEQDIWPGTIWRTHRRGIPLALINARMNDEAFARRRHWTGLFRDVFARFDLVSAQDAATATNLANLGAPSPRLDGSLKPISPPLDADATLLKQWQTKTKDRFVWINAPSHATDEAFALKTHAEVLKTTPDATLIIAPRFPDRGPDLLLAAESYGFSVCLRSSGLDTAPIPQESVADTIGEIGLWYRLARAVLIGGTFCDIEGHNPWEALVLGLPVFFGTRTGHFESDFRYIEETEFGMQVHRPDELAAVLTSDHLEKIADSVQSKKLDSPKQLKGLVDALTNLLPSENNAGQTNPHA